jgi:hypothetical protein
MTSEVRAHERTDGDDQQLFASCKIQRRLCEPCGNSLATNRWWHLGVIEDQPMRGIVVISKERHSFWNAYFELLPGDVVLRFERVGHAHVSGSPCRSLLDRASALQICRRRQGAESRQFRDDSMIEPAFGVGLDSAEVGELGHGLIAEDATECGVRELADVYRQLV